MIYLVSNQQELFDNDSYKAMTVKESLDILKQCKVIQYDSETSGRDAHINKLLCIQFGSKDKDIQIVVDCETIDIKVYKDILESKYIIGHNLKFDLQFLYNYNIIPRKVYDTMIVEQLLYLGYPSGIIKYSLKEVAWRRLNIDIDKTVRGEIIWRGLDTRTILYSAGDVMYLEDIMHSQIKDCKEKECLIGAKLECDCVPAMAYLEWCGIKLDADKWKAKMVNDAKGLEEAKKTLDTWFISKFNNDDSTKVVSNIRKTIGYTPYSNEEYNKYLEDKKELESLGYRLIKEEQPGSNMAMHMFIYENINAKPSIERNSLSKYIKIDRQGDLFLGFNTEPQCIINWSSSRQVVEVAKVLGFNTTIQDKKTGEDKDSVLEKYLKSQKGINDEFLKLYFNYQEKAKVVSTYGQAQLNMINPNTGRCHTVYKQLGASSGRMSCGSQQPNTDLAKLKKISPKDCTYCNFQQLPADDVTRGAFIPEEYNLMCDCDFSAMESYLGADIYEDLDFQEEFLHGSKDTHSLFAWMVFRKECEDLGCTCVSDVKSKAPQWRKAVKAVEFAWMFGAAAKTISEAANCTEEEAQEYINRLEQGFKGISKFAREGSKFVRKNGYVLMNKYTGHKMYWWDHDVWVERQESFTPDFWTEYREKHKGTGDLIAQEVREHFQAASKWDRMVRNSVTQGTGATIIKTAATNFFNWIVDNNLFNKVLICAIVHDEILIEYPKELKVVPILENIMEEASSKFCKFSKIPAKGEIGDHWLH